MIDIWTQCDENMIFDTKVLWFSAYNCIKTAYIYTLNIIYSNDYNTRK